MGSLPATSASRRFGKYTLVAKLAQGGMAEIFLARLGGIGGFEKLVCIKRILPEYAKDPDFVAMFLSEARIAARISHPNVCQVFELGELEGQYFIAMEYLEGVPLAAFRRPEHYAMPPDPRLVVGIAVQGCEGLHHAHQLKGPDGSMLELVHRDVSPQNLFVTIDGIVKVLDFGIAKIQNASHKTTTGAVKGTYAFMAPEQLKGEGVDRRSDVFALGAVVWEVLARRHLFRRDTDFLTFQAITTNPIPDVCTFRPDIPPEIGRVIARALARDREERWPSARAFGAALAQAVGPLGGPLSQGEVGDLVTNAFSHTLEEQRALVAVARDGGEFDLEEDRGGLGQGSSAITPVSALRRTSDLLRVPVGPPSATLDVVSPSSVSTQRPPAPSDSSRLVSIVLLVLLAVAVGAGGMFYLFVYKRDQAVQQVAAVPPEPVVMSVVSDAGAPAPTPPPVAAPPDAAEATPTTPTVPDEGSGSGSGSGSVETPEPPPRVTNRPRPRPTPRPTPAPTPAPVPSGPPGSITIDSSPVYAVIFIDGKRFGETPLIDIKLSPGKHSVKAVSATGGTKNLTITIQSGKKAPGRRIEW